MPEIARTQPPTARTARTRAAALIGAFCAALLATSVHVHAQSGPGARARDAVVERDAANGVTVNWTRGMILAVGAAHGDVRAPSPAVARLTATRRAREQARERLMNRVLSLRAGASTVTQRARADDQLARRLEQAVERSVEVAIDHHSDGSVVYTAGLPLEAARVALHGVPGPFQTTASAPTALVIDARGAMKRPIMGPELVLGDARYRGPTLYHRSVARAVADPRAGQRVLRARAKTARNGRLLLAPGKGAPMTAAQLDAAAKSGALVLIVIGTKP